MRDIAVALTEWDRATFIALNHAMKNPALDVIMPLITDVGLGHVQAMVVAALAIVLGIRAGAVHGGNVWSGIRHALYSRRAWVAPLLLSYALGGLAATGLKAIPRERPWWFYLHQHEKGLDTDVRVLTVEGVYPLKVRGFPSGHTATSVGMATVVTLLWYRRRNRAWLIAAAWALALIVAVSRIYLASHWPLDLLGGAALGITSGILSMWLCRSWAHKFGPHEESAETTASESA